MVLDLGPAGIADDLLESLEVDPFVLDRERAGLEIGERILDRARDPVVSEVG